MKSDFESQQSVKRSANMREHHSLASISNQYLETTRLLIQSYDKILSKYFTLAERDSQLIEKLFEKMICLFRLTDKNVFNDVSKVIGNCLRINGLDIKKKYIILDEVGFNARLPFGSNAIPRKSSRCINSWGLFKPN